MHARNLMNIVGDEEAIFKESKQHLKAIPRLPEKVIDEIHNTQVLHRAERELNFVEKNNLRLMFFTDEEYPQRLVHCIDAPILLYGKGDVDMNRKKIVSVVGTRNASRYGLLYCEEFIRELAVSDPDILVVSGLAYGIDICAISGMYQRRIIHSSCFSTWFRPYLPSLHRQTAVDMLQEGALLTEFPSETNPIDSLCEAKPNCCRDG